MKTFEANQDAGSDCTDRIRKTPMPRGGDGAAEAALAAFADMLIVLAESREILKAHQVVNPPPNEVEGEPPTLRLFDRTDAELSNTDAEVPRMADRPRRGSTPTKKRSKS